MKRILPITLFMLFAGMSCEKDNGEPKNSLNFSFNDDTQGWTAFFSDYPQGSEEHFQLSFGHAMLPAPLDTTLGALRISGINHSDDLLSMIVRKIDGLQPGRQYDIIFDVEVASNTPSNSVGIGGSPDLAFGVGAIPFAPSNSPDIEGWLRPNFSSELQSRMSNDTIQMVGTIGVGDDASDYTLIRRGNAASPLRATSNEDGVLWLLIGTDSGFEGTTTLYYRSVKIKLN
jgi:hypothetical protein